MDILLILLSGLGIGYLGWGTGAIVKDSISKSDKLTEYNQHSNFSDKLKDIFKVLGLYIVVYIVLNIIVLLLFLLLFGNKAINDGLRENIILCNLALALIITYLIRKYAHNVSVK